MPVPVDYRFHHQCLILLDKLHGVEDEEAREIIVCPMVTAGTKMLEGMPDRAPPSHIQQNGVPSLRASICQYVKDSGCIPGIACRYSPLAFITIIGTDDDSSTSHLTN